MLVLLAVIVAVLGLGWLLLSARKPRVEPTVAVPEGAVLIKRDPETGFSQAIPGNGDIASYSVSMALDDVRRFYEDRGLLCSDIPAGADTAGISALPYLRPPFTICEGPAEPIGWTQVQIQRQSDVQLSPDLGAEAREHRKALLQPDFANADTDVVILALVAWNPDFLVN